MDLTRIRFVVAAGAVASLSSWGVAGSEFSVLDTGTPDGSGRYGVHYNPVGNHGQSFAFRFDITESTQLSRLDVYWGGDADDSALVMLVDSLGPGTTFSNVLEAWTFTGTGLSGNQGQWESHATDRVVGAGTYHIIVTPLNNDANGGWLPTDSPNNVGFSWRVSSVRSPESVNFVPASLWGYPIEGRRMGYRVFAVPAPGAACVFALAAFARRRWR